MIIVTNGDLYENVIPLLMGYRRNVLIQSNPDKKWQVNRAVAK